ncbi:MAG: FtsX-like permease family protein, partial [Hyphomicrobiaceae bacterium]
MTVDLTVATAAASISPTRPGLGRLLRIAIQDLRGNLRSFSVFLACLALGVAAIAGVGTIADAVKSGLDTKGRVLLGGDLALSRMHVRASAPERAWLETKGELSEIATLRAMARRPGAEALRASALAEVKAVDTRYPLTGKLTLETGDDARPLLDRGLTAVVDRLLAERLGVGIGDGLMLGDSEVVIAGFVGHEPDKLAAQASFGPRVLISLETLAATGLAKPGSLTRWTYRLAVPDGAVSAPEDFEGFRKETRAAFPEAGFQIADRRDPAPGVRRAVDRLGQFLTLVGLTTLLIGGAGVANAVAAYLDRKRRTIAVLRALGASSSSILAIYHIEILLLASIGIGIGLVAGMSLPAAGVGLLGDMLPFPIDIVVTPLRLLLATAYGVLVALLFAMWPLGRIEHVSAALLFRDEINTTRQRPSWPFLLATAIALALIASLAVLTAEDRRLALYFVGGLSALFAVFLWVGRLVPWLAGRWPSPARPESRLAVRNLAGPGSLARTATLSLGTGLSLLVAIALVDRSLVAELEGGLPERAPSYFFLDIGKGEIGPLSTLLDTSGGQVSTAPMLRGRLVALKGKPVEEIEAPPGAEWVLSGDRGLTFSEAPPATSRIVDGTWWPKDYAGEPLVSFDVELAKNLGLAVGDTLTVNVLGRNVTARIANLRTVDWDRLAINFVMIFSPNTLASAPYNVLATLSFPEQPQLAQEARLIQAVA